MAYLDTVLKAVELRRKTVSISNSLSGGEAARRLRVDEWECFSFCKAYLPARIGNLATSLADCIGSKLAKFSRPSGVERRRYRRECR